MLERRIHWRPYVSLQSFRFHTICKELDSVSIIVSRNEDQLLSIAVSWTSCWLNTRSSELEQLFFPALTWDAIPGNGFVYIYFLSERFQFPHYTVGGYLIRWRIQVLVWFNLQTKIENNIQGIWIVNSDHYHLHIIPFHIFILYREVI